MLQLRKPWDSQPQEVAEVADGLLPLPIIAVPGGGSWGRQISPRYPATFTTSGAVSERVLGNGIGYDFGGAAYIDLGARAVLPSTTAPFTFTWLESLQTTAGFPAIACFFATGATQKWIACRTTSGSYSTVFFGVTGSGAPAVRAASAPALAVGVPRRFLIVGRGGMGSSTPSDYSLYCDGVEYTTSGGGTQGASSAGPNTLGWDSFDDKFNGQLADMFLWDSAFTPGQVQAYFSNPHQVFTPRTIWVPVSAAAGGAYTITADAGAYAIGGQDAALVKSRIVAADAGAYSLAGQDAALTYAPAAGAYTLTAEPGAYVLGGQDAALKRGRVVSADAGAYALAGQNATLTYAPPNAYTLTCEAGAYAIGGQAATIAFSGATQATTGGWLGQRRRTKREIDNDWRKLVGLDPIEDEPDYLPEAVEVAEVVKPQRKTITVSSLKPINVDNFVNAIKAKKRRRDEEFLLLMD